VEARFEVTQASVTAAAKEPSNDSTLLVVVYVEVPISGILRPATNRANTILLREHPVVVLNRDAVGASKVVVALIALPRVFVPKTF
jgi:hypothetical protein